jgi:hypothetical protein
MGSKRRLWDDRRGLKEKGERRGERPRPRQRKGAPVQSEDTARIARLEQLLDAKQQENDKLKEDLEGLRVAIRAVVTETFNVFESIDRQTGAGKMRLERTLGRPFTNERLIDELAQHTVTSWATT